MINTLLIDPVGNKTELLNSILERHCPNVRIETKIKDVKIALKVIEQNQPKLILLDINSLNTPTSNLLNYLDQQDREFIILTDSEETRNETIQFNPSGYVMKPINPYDFVATVKNARRNLRYREENKVNKKLLNKINVKLSSDDLIGIPTMEGYDFIKINEIIRCKGMQRCTQVVTKTKSNIVSSYNLGEFRKLLEPLGFFSPHKSHLINLNCIEKYRREGAIIMLDGIEVPISRRKKGDFLKTFKHV